MQRSCYHVYVMQANKLLVNIISLFWDPCIDNDQSQLENWNYICQNLNKAMLSAILQSGHSCLRGQANLSFWQENLWYGNLLFISNCAMKSVTSFKVRKWFILCCFTFATKNGTKSTDWTNSHETCLTRYKTLLPIWWPPWIILF